jgi:hypothetical protein
MALFVLCAFWRFAERRWQIHGSFSNTAVAKIIQQNKTVFVR